MAKSFWRPLLYLLALNVLLAVSTLEKLSAADWEIRNPRLIGPQLNAIASSATRAVAVGQGGHIVTSADGAAWSAQNLGTNRHFSDVIYANARFVAVGAFYNASGVHSLAATSTDGVSWTERPTDSRAWKSIAYGNGRFVAVGDHTIDTSPDGITWTRRTPHSYMQFQGVAYGNGVFVTMGVWTDGRGNYAYSVQRSSDGITWTGSPAPVSAVLRGIAFGGGQFVMVGDSGLVFSSSNGIEWTWQNSLITGIPLNDVTFANGLFVAVGPGGMVIRSSDAVTWFHRWRSEPRDLFGCGYAFGRFVAVGEGSAILASADQQTWTSPVSATYSDWLGITFAQQKFVAVGSRAMTAVSNDGQQWTPRSVFEGTGEVSSTWLNAVAFGKNLFVAVGGMGAPVFQSADANSWGGGTANLGSDTLFGLTYAAGRFVWVGTVSTGYGMRGAVGSSSDGTNWVRGSAQSAQALQCITYGNGLWVAAGAELFTSTDSLNWTAKTSPATGTLYAAAFGAGRFVLAGDVSGMVTSTDGNQWTFQPAFGGSQICGLAFGNNQFVAVGRRGNSGVIWSSSGGLTWTESAVTPAPLKAVAYGNNSFTAVGDAGLVVQSSSTTAAQLMITRTANGSVEISCRAPIGQQCRLQASSDGRAWQDLMSFRATASDPPYRDTVGTRQMRLYRLVSP